MNDPVLKARDCSPIRADQESFDHEWLRSLASQDVRELVVRLGPENGDSDPIVFTDPRGRWRAGRYVGEVQFQGRSLRIEPRFGHDIGEWLAEVLNLAVVPDMRGRLSDGPSYLELLLGVMWSSALARAAKHGLPFLRRPLRHEGYDVRGRIKVSETVARRAHGLPLFVSEVGNRSLDNPIARTAVVAYQTLHKRLLKRGASDDTWLSKRGQDLLPRMIRACGPWPPLPSPTKIRRIRYSPITEGYRPFVSLSDQIARWRGGRPDLDSSQDRVAGLLLDVAELWELYVVNSARAAITFGRAVHGTRAAHVRWHVGMNAAGKVLQRIIPDLVVEEAGSIRVIADAKYKQLASRWVDGGHRTYERADLYQLVTYLEALGDESSIDGCLVYPREECPSAEESDGPWVLRSGHRVWFLRLPRTKDAARLEWQRFFGGLSW